MFSLMKKQKHYTVTLTQMTGTDPNTVQTLTFEFEDRECLFKIIEKLKKGDIVEDNEVPRFALGLRLIGPLVMSNRKSSLFAEFVPHFKAFMANVKKRVKKS
ncbi:DUF3861 family protein [Vibrio sinaloensis]|uniref:DUF3861 family protein n=1 Tax=Photobacterium sp. (strain ATCC 43367) TaxID=379097 RepID=UPI00057C391A|nr:DUF3861 family protein [Vibrio sinaloensis]KHT51880.1 hypothetical protein RJ46_03950 [Vibrio sinaloensis]